jgi:hypothetical protein
MHETCDFITQWLKDSCTLTWLTFAYMATEYATEVLQSEGASPTDAIGEHLAMDAQSVRIRSTSVFFYLLHVLHKQAYI